MKKYLFVETWNGEGYSNSEAFVLSFNSKEEADTKALYKAQECAGDGVTEFGKIKPEDYSEIVDPTLFGYTYNIGEDSGAISVVEFDDHMVGLSIDPCVNDFTVFNDRKEWDEYVQLIRDNSDDIEDSQDDEQIFGTIHHVNDEVPVDSILFTKEMLLNGVKEEDVNFDDGGDGVEYEVWVNPKTNQLYRVPIEIVRNFDNAEPVESYHEAKFGN